MDIVLPVIHWKSCLQTINQFISESGNISPLLSLFLFPFTFYLHLSSTCTPPDRLPSLILSVSHSSLLLLVISPTCVCSPSIIFYAFPERSCVPKTETKRLWYKPVCVGRAPYLHIEFSQLVFCCLEGNKSYWDYSGLFYCSSWLHWWLYCIGAAGCVSIP